MRTIPLPMLRAALFGNSAFADLLEIYYSEGDEPDLRLAMYDQDLTVDGERYIAAGMKMPLKVRNSLEDSLGDLRIVLPDVRRAIAILIETVDLAGTPAVVRRIALNDLSGSSVVMFHGVIRNPIVMQGTTASITLSPSVADPEGFHTVPRRAFSGKCGWRFGDPDTCGVDKGLYSYSGVVGEGSSALVIRDEGLTADVIESLKTVGRVDDAGDDVLSALPADLIFTSGVCERQARPLENLTPCTMALARPFYSTPAIGDTFTLERRCAKTIPACRGYQNIDRNGSFHWTPRQPRNLRRELLG